TFFFAIRPRPHLPSITPSRYNSLTLSSPDVPHAAYSPAITYHSTTYHFSSSPAHGLTPDRDRSNLSSMRIEQATLAACPAQAKLLSAVTRSPCLKPSELPPVPDDMRKPPRIAKPSPPRTHKELFDNSPGT
ncbi:MAG: hypothetical protein V2A58_06090, partial [Planctomycetota bacterium]